MHKFPPRVPPWKVLKRQSRAMVWMTQQAKQFGQCMASAPPNQLKSWSVTLTETIKAMYALRDQTEQNKCNRAASTESWVEGERPPKPRATGQNDRGRTLGKKSGSCQLRDCSKAAWSDRSEPDLAMCLYHGGYRLTKGLCTGSPQ